MAGDVVQRLQSVKKWLDKAEQAFSRHKTVSGEINLIMAQAEMERLKEVHASRRGWLLQAGALCMALFLAAGISSVYYFGEAENVQKAVSPALPSRAEPADSVKAETMEKPVIPAANIEVKEAPPVETAVTAKAAETVPAAPAAPAPSQNTAAPVLSPRELQSVVGEAGRALRGQ